MRRRRIRARLRLALGVVFAASAIWFVIQLFFVSSSFRTVLIAVVTSSLSVLAFAFSYLSDALKNGSGALSPERLDHIANELAEATLIHWKRVERERGLTGERIPVTWSISELQKYATPLSMAFGGDDFPIIPRSDKGPDEMKVPPRVEDLREVFGVLRSGRLIITGEAGAGKTSAAIRLLTEILDNRHGDRDIPVPVLVPIQGWEPGDVEIVDWAARKLKEDYLNENSSVDMAAVSELFNQRDRVILILDGSDEMGVKRLRMALSALARPARDHRFVLLSRTDELESVVTGHESRVQFWEDAGRRTLNGAAIIELRAVEHSDAVAYLRSRIPEATEFRRELISLVEGNPEGVLAEVLRNPLFLNLVGDSCVPVGGLGELLRLGNFQNNPDWRYGNRDTREERIKAVRQHILGCVLPAVYNATEDAGKDGGESGYRIDVARNILHGIAVQMKRGNKESFRWWEIVGWLDSQGRHAVICIILGMLAAGLAAGIAMGVAGGVSTLIAGHFVAGLPGYLFSPWLGRGLLGWIVVGLIAGVDGGISIGLFIALIVWIIIRFADPENARPGEGRRLPTWRDLVAGGISGLVSGLIAGVGYAATSSISAGMDLSMAEMILVFGAAVWFAGYRRRNFDAIPKVSKDLSRANLFTLRNIGASVVVGILFGIIEGGAYNIISKSAPGSEYDPKFGVAAGIVCAVEGMVILFVSRAFLGGGKSMRFLAPDSSWRKNRAYGVWVGTAAGLLIGVADGLATGITGPFMEFGTGPYVGVIDGVAGGVGTGVVVGLLSSKNFSVMLAWLQLGFKWRAHVRMMDFLNYAHKNDVLRTDGVAFQFRHSLLRDYLAETSWAGFGPATHRESGTVPEEHT